MERGEIHIVSPKNWPQEHIPYIKRLRKKRAWESQDLNVSPLGMHIQEAKMHVMGEKLWFLEGVEVLAFILYAEEVRRNHKIIFFAVSRQ